MRNPRRRRVRFKLRIRGKTRFHDANPSPAAEKLGFRESPTARYLTWSDQYKAVLNSSKFFENL